MPSTIALSRKFSETAATLIRTSSSFGVGVGTSPSRRLSSPKLSSCHAFIVAISLVRIYSNNSKMEKQPEKVLNLSEGRHMGALQNEPKKADLQLTAILNALSDDTRLQIVQTLAKTEEVACSYFDIHMPKSSLSHHFRVLRSAGVITTRKEGTALLNRL